MDTVIARLKPLGLKPQPTWHQCHFRALGYYLVLRMVRGDRILKTQKYDQIINIQSSRFQENTELNFASFNNKVDSINQFRHEIIHPIAWKIAINIFGGHLGNYSDQTEFIAGGIDLFINKGGEYIGPGPINKIVDFYGHIFQLSVSQVMEDCLKGKQEKFIQKILDLTNNSEDLYMQNDDFCLSYRSIFEYLECDLGADLVGADLILDKIQAIIIEIKQKGNFKTIPLLNNNEKKLPEINDCLEIFKNYDHIDIFNSIKDKRIYAPKEILDKYEL